MSRFLQARGSSAASSIEPTWYEPAPHSLSFLLTLLLTLFSLPLLAQQLELPSVIGDLPSPQESLVALRLEFTGTDGARVTGKVTADIREGWHINSSTPLDSFAIPTELELESSVLKIERLDFPPHLLRAFGFSGGKELAVYEGTLAVPFVAAKLGDRGPVTARLRYQACNDRVCLPPRSVAVESSFDSAGVAGRLVAPPSPNGSFVELAKAPRTKNLFSSDVQGTFSSRGLPLTLLAVFVLGLALNLTPCVYPLIPITIAFFSAQSEGKRSQRALLSLTYVLGIAVTYSALGVFSALSGRLFGAWLQLPAVLIFFALLMLVLAASMFGLFEIRVPHFITDRAGARGGYLGSLTMGLLVGIVAAPCVGPFVISLIALVGQIGSPYLGFLLFFVLALGLGLPYLLLGIFSSGVASIPRSGLWMVQVKKAIGFVLIAMAIYFVRPLIGEEMFRWGVAASLLAGGTFLLATGWKGKGGGHSIRIACAALLLVAGLWFALQRSKEGMTWKPYSPALLADAAKAARPVVIDFYADWCLPCKELDAKTFTDDSVIREGNRFTRLKADLSRSDDPQSKELTARYRIIGVPTIVFVDGTGREDGGKRLTGFEAAAPFLERMKSVR